MSPLASGIVMTLSFIFFASRKTFDASRDDDIAEPYQEDIDADASLMPPLTTLPVVCPWDPLRRHSQGNGSEQMPSALPLLGV